MHPCLRQRVIVESPYAGDIVRNITYARRAVRDSVLRGEAPIASHLLFPAGILDDDIPKERALGRRGAPPAGAEPLPVPAKLRNDPRLRCRGLLIV
jgi:hypothetical protein